MLEEKKRSRSGCLWGVIVLQFLGLAALGLAVLVLAGLLGVSDLSAYRAAMGEDENPAMREIWTYGSGDAKVINIPLQGLIVLDEDPGMFGSLSGTADQALRSIRCATHDPDVMAIILSVDSGGGGMTASDILYRELMEFKASQPGRKVVAMLGDVAASGAYYVSLAADRVIAHPTTLTGSIGVLIQSLNFRELGQKHGIRDITIKSGANKDMLNPMGECTEEQRAMLQELVDEMHGRFVKLVAEGRHLKEEEVRQFADGRIWTASKALELGLLDELGYWPDAMDRTAEILGTEDVKVFRYEAKRSFSSLLWSALGANPLSRALQGLSVPRLMYLWQL